MKLGIIGIGLIGVSIAKELKSFELVSKTYGCDTNETNSAKALELEVFDELK